MATPTPITAFTPVFKPLTQITPFTFRDGYTFLEMYSELRQYLVKLLGPEIDAKLTLIYTETQAMVNALAKDVNASKNAWQALFDEFMANIIVELEALNDQAVENLVRDTQSQLRVALNDNFIQAVGAYTFYVNKATGSDTNAGTSGAPFKTVKFALDEVMKLTTKSNVQAVVDIASGTYAERYVFPDFTPFNANILIRGASVGGHPFTPVTVFTEGAGASAICIINRNSGITWTVKDIQFNGYSGTASSGALNNNNGSLITDNVHIDGCYYGITSFRGTLIVPNGKITNCGYLPGGGGSGAGIRSMMLNRHSIGIQAAGTRANTLIIEGCYSGFFAQENSTGHVDWVTIRNCGRGINLNVGSRANADGTLLEDCSTGVYATANAHVYVSSSTQFVNCGTRVSCSGGAEYLAGSGVDFADVSSSISRGLEIVNASYSTVVSSTVDKFFYRKKFIGEWFADTFLISGTPCKRIKTRSVIELTGIEGTKVVTVRHIGGATAVTFSANEIGMYEFETEVMFLTNGTQIVSIRSTTNLLPPRYFVLERNSTLTGEMDIAIQFRTTSSADTARVLFTEMSMVK